VCVVCFFHLSSLYDWPLGCRVSTQINENWIELLLVPSSQRTLLFSVSFNSRLLSATNLFRVQKFNRFCGLVVRVPGQRSRVRFPALPHFLRSSGSGTGSTQPRECEELLEWKISGSGSRKPILTAVGIRCADRSIPSIRKSWRRSLGRYGSLADIYYSFSHFPLPLEIL
jgi:hypothetical protein